MNAKFAHVSASTASPWSRSSTGTIESTGRREPDGLEHSILRPRLIDAIDSPEIAPITLITAPAGFGKSTLAAQWSRESYREVIWVSLLPESNTPDRFLSDLQRALDAGGADFPPPEMTAQGPTSNQIIARMRELSASRPTTIVFDDYHLIENTDVHRVMNAVIHELPPDVSVMILSRGLPPLALGRLRIEGRVREITEVELRFDRPDVAALVAAEAKRRLTSEQIARLVDRTDGWIAGIRLALLAVVQAEDERIDTLIDALPAHQWLDDYIVEEVLDDLPEELRNFVLRTTSLGMLEPKVCDAVLGIARSAALIDDLARRLVFVRRDTRSGAGVSYHALFAECVKRVAERMLPATELLDDRRRAAAWLEEHDRYEEALDHAMVCEDWAAALRIVRAICQPLWDRDLHYSLLYWMEKLPIEQTRADHELLYWYIHKLFSTGQVREAMLQLEIAEPLWEASGSPVELAFILSCRSFKLAFEGDSGAGLQYGYRALHYFPAHHWVSRMRTWTGICEKEFWRGNDELATKAFHLAEYCRRFLPAEQRWWTLNTETQRINQYALRGKLPTAERLYQAALLNAPPQFRDAEGRTRFKMAAIYLEWNDLGRAQGEVDRITHDLERFPWQFWYPEARLIEAQVALAKGRYEIVETTLKRLLTALENLGETHTAERAGALRARLWLEQGELLLASAWGDNLLAEECGWPLTYGETDPYLVLIQLRMAQQDYAAVLSLATARISDGVELKRHAELVPLYVWQAVALRALGRQDGALDALRSALRAGMPGRFNASFFPFGVDLTSFYVEAQSALLPTEAAYLEQLLLERSLPVVIEAPGGSDAPAVELLSPREREILELIRDGLSSSEIADRLFVGESTIKKHLTRGFFKLKVNNRTAAVIRAQELGLLR